LLQHNAILEQILHILYDHRLRTLKITREEGGVEPEVHQTTTIHAEADEEGEETVGIEQMEVLTNAQDGLRMQ